MATRCLDSGERGERTWSVLTHRLAMEGAYSGQALERFRQVTAQQMTVVEGGTLTFTAADGTLVRAFGPGGWLEVSRA